MSEGKIVCIVGSPASGKSWISKRLAKYYGAELILEINPDEFPDEIKTYLSTQTNLFPNQIWFRSVHVTNYKKALRYKGEGKDVILDCPFYQNQVYNGLYIKDKFQKEVLDKMGEIDLETFEQPDITIYLKNNPEILGTFLKNRTGNMDWENDSWRNFVVEIIPHVDDYINKIKDKIPNFVELNREEWDFKKEEDFDKLVGVIEDKIYISKI